MTAKTPLGRLRPHLRRLWPELLVVIWLCWIYDAINNLSPLRQTTALRNASWFLRSEKALHLDPEAALDHWMSHHRTLALVVSNYYDNAHFVVTFAVLALLWWKYWPALYRPMRNALVLTNLIAMAIFWALPTAPPRLLNGSVYPDVVAQSGALGSWHSGALSHAANEYAAMPSLHIGWACWSAMGLWMILEGRRWRVLVWLYPLVTSLAVLSTGNHFLADVVAGAAIFVVSMWLADRWDGWWTSRQARRALEAKRALGADAEIEQVHS